MLAIFFSFWRRWFGGGYCQTWLKNYRPIQCVVFILVNFLICMKYVSNIYLAIALDIYLYAQFWSRGHGACYDIGRGEVDESIIKRYNERWYHYPLDKLFKNHKYGFLYDFLYMFMRYTCPMIPLAFLSLNFLYVGMLISPIYAFSWTIQEKESWIFEKFKYAKSSTNLGEYLVGFIYGFLL